MYLNQRKIKLIKISFPWEIFRSGIKKNIKELKGQLKLKRYFSVY